MNFDFASVQRRFWASAPDQPGFKPLYAAVFCGALSLLEEAGARSIDITFALLHGRTKVSQEAYTECLKWLDANGHWQYFEGKGRHAKARIYVQAAEVALTVKPSPATGITVAETRETAQFYIRDFTPCTGVGMGGSTGVGNGVSTGVGSQKTDEPVLIRENIKGLPGGPVFFKPSNIDLTGEEEADLLGGYGIEKTNKALLKVSQLKRKNGKLAKSDFFNVVSWAMRQVEEDDRIVAQAKRGTHHITNQPAPSKPGRYGREIT